MRLILLWYSRPIPSKPQSIPAFNAWFPCHQVTGRVAVAHGRQGQGGGRFGGLERKRRQALRIGSGAAAKRRPWRVRRTSTLAWRRGQRQASFFLFSFCHGAFFFRVASCSSRRSRCECFSRLSVLRRGVCRQGGAPLDLFPLFASCLCFVESFHALQLGSLFFVVVKPQQSPDSLIWQECLFPCFFDRAHRSLSAIAVGRGVEVACNDVCIIFHKRLS